MKHFVRVDDNGSEVEKLPAAWIDGYAIGERVLEGIPFRITITTRGKFKAEVDPSDAEYFDTLNLRYWICEVENFCKDNDLWQSKPHGNQDDVICVDDTDV